MELTVISVYDLRVMIEMELPGIIEGHMEEKIFYTDSFLSYAESLKQFVTQDLLESYEADVIGVRVMYISVDRKIKLFDKIVREKIISTINQLISTRAAVILKEKRFSVFNPRKYGYYGNFTTM
ncbi:conserved hypothetical protein [Candidatus Desulfosporosinus infrequens]|uniref:Uncharacterized protein n=1 Tax=Candidatus Desulfosporosinus infrequens TaxID=2043169 RepID=A0A2U3KPL8_9FIRM|nr:conserved hypothetical protein [Candidatus Desulfosporosinus infrequens]